MELQTTMREVHNGQKGSRAEAKIPISDLGKRPFQLTSSYQHNFPNWKNGAADIFHEKHPQYPIYSLPFTANSIYKVAFTDD